LSHRNARLTPNGRRILVDRILSGRPVAHVAKELGVSRQCAHRWLARYRDEGPAGLEDRSSRPRSSPHATTPQITDRILAIRAQDRWSRDEIAAIVPVSATTVSRILRRAGCPPLRDLDPVTGTPIRATRTTHVRYEREHPGELIHIDVKKLGRIPLGGGWRANGTRELNHHRGRGIGFDHVHVAVDDHSRLAFAQVLPDERAATCAAFLQAALDFFHAHGIRVREVMTDNALNYTRAHDFQHLLAVHGIRHRRTRPYSPWQNGKAERFNRTLQERWAYRRAYTSNEERAEALDPFLEWYNYARPHHALGGRPPITRVSTTY